jgi:gentisate 1,2-dioxygenase
MESGGLITAEEAKRRVLILENPSMPGESKATNTLFAGIQMIMPGEVAPAHRHVAAAIRFVLDGEGAYTAVDGEKAFMSPGDFVITANWAPHDHGNTSKKPMLWLDVLDFPAVNFFEASFADSFDEPTQATTRKDGDSLSMYGSGVLPDGAWDKSYTPVINYTYKRTRPIVERMMQAGEIDKRHGARVHYANPVTGGPVLPTMGAWLAMFPKGFKGEPYRATDGTIFVCVEGEGKTTVDGKDLDWGPNDVFVVPPWKRYSHNVAKEAVLFSISDRPAQKALGIWRRDRFKLGVRDGPGSAVHRCALHRIRETVFRDSLLHPRCPAAARGVRLRCACTGECGGRGARFRPRARGGDAGKRRAARRESR